MPCEYLGDKKRKEKVILEDALKNIEKAFFVSLPEMKKFIRDFHREMKKSLSGQKSSLLMLPAYVRRPKGTETGSFLALDLGGTNFRVFFLKLEGKRRTRSPLSGKFVLDKRHITGMGEDLFGFIADCVKAFMEKYKIDKTKKHDMGFTFSFPIKKRNLASGVLLKWTKGFRATGVKGKDVVKLLNESLKRKGLVNTKAVAIANDTVSTLVAGSYEDPNCDIGVILGTGTNACYYEKLANIVKLKKNRLSPKEQMIVNIEWGNFNKFCLTPYDKDLDKRSANPGKQLLEKMISGMYLGKIVKFLANDLINGIRLPGNFQSEHVSAIEEDSSKNLSGIEKLLKSLAIPNSEYIQRKLLKKICFIVSTRAARLSAAGMAAVITKIDPAVSKKHTIAIDGSVYEKHQGFSRRIKSALKEVFGKKASRVNLILTKDASAKGAAIIAAI